MAKIEFPKTKLARGDHGVTCEANEECGVCSICRVAEFNEKTFGLKPLDRVGSPEYYSAVWASLKREAAARGKRRSGTAPRSKRVRVKAVRRSKAELAPQCCAACDEMIESGPAFAVSKHPTVFCPPCAEIHGNRSGVLTWGIPSGMRNQIRRIR